MTDRCVLSVPCMRSRTAVVERQQVFSQEVRRTRLSCHVGIFSRHSFLYQDGEIRVTIVLLLGLHL